MWQRASGLTARAALTRSQTSKHVATTQWVPHKIETTTHIDPDTREVKSTTGESICWSSLQERDEFVLVRSATLARVLNIEPSLSNKPTIYTLQLADKPDRRIRLAVCHHPNTQTLLDE